MSAKVKRHPHTQQLFVHACEKWQRAKKDHRKAAQMMWAGYLRMHFQDSELAMLREAGFLSPADEALLRVGETNGTF